MCYPTGTKHISEKYFILAFLSTNKGLEGQKLDCRILEDKVLPSLHSKMGSNHPNLDEFVCLFLSINGLYKHPMLEDTAPITFPPKIDCVNHPNLNDLLACSEI